MGVVAFRGELTLPDGHVIQIDTSQATSGSGAVIDHVRGVLRSVFLGAEADVVKHQDRYFGTSDPDATAISAFPPVSRHHTN